PRKFLPAGKNRMFRLRGATKSMTQSNRGRLPPLPDAESSSGLFWREGAVLGWSARSGLRRDWKCAIAVCVPGTGTKRPVPGWMSRQGSRREAVNDGGIAALVKLPAGPQVAAEQHRVLLDQRFPAVFAEEPGTLD